MKDKISDAIENEKEDKLHEEKEVEEDESTYISWDDWSLPIEFDRDITNCDIIFTIKNSEWDTIYRSEKLSWEHIWKEKTLFEIPHKSTSKIKWWEYKRNVTVYDNDTDKRVSTKPECFYVTE